MLKKADSVEFHKELVRLLQKYDTDSYLFATITYEGPSGELADMPIMVNITAGPRASRINGVFTENVLGALIRGLMKWNGLTFAQAVGALQESASAAA